MNRNFAVKCYCAQRGINSYVGYGLLCKLVGASNANYLIEASLNSGTDRKRFVLRHGYNGVYSRVIITFISK